MNCTLVAVNCSLIAIDGTGTPVGNGCGKAAVCMSLHLEDESRAYPDLHRHAQDPTVVNSLFGGLLLALHEAHSLSVYREHAMISTCPSPQMLHTWQRESVVFEQAVKNCPLSQIVLVQDLHPQESQMPGAELQS